MGDNELNGTPEGVTPDGASEQNAASQLQDQQNAGQYGQQTNQQYVDQYGQQMTQSTYDQTMNMYGDQAHKPETPKKRKGIKIAIISVVAALIVIAALVVVYLVFLKKTPKEVVEDAMENTAKELENGNISGIVGANDLDLDNIEFNSQVSLDNVSGAEALSGTQIECNGCTAFGDSNDFKISGSMTAAGEKATAEILSIGNKIYFSSPELLTKTLVLDANTIMSELGGTEAGAEIGRAHVRTPVRLLQRFLMRSLFLQLINLRIQWSMRE